MTRPGDERAGGFVTRDGMREGRPRGQDGPRVPPNDTAAEESVLGGILLDNKAADAVLERLVADDFYRPAHALVYRAMVELVDKREPIDIVTLSGRLRSMNAFDDVGGTDALVRLASGVPSAANVAYYADLVKERSLRRRVITAASEIISEAFEGHGSVQDFLDVAEQRILKVSDYRVAKSFYRVGDIAHASVHLIEKLFEQKEPVTGVPSGLGDLDVLTSGFQPSDLVIIAARPSMGKTALALSIASHVGVDKKKAVVIFSLEMSKEQLVLRVLCAEAEVDNARVRSGNLLEGQFSDIVAAAGRIGEADVYIDDTPGLTITELRAKCRRLHREKPLSLVIVDYLQLMRSPAYSHSREQEISDISRSLKGLAKELDVPVIALSQLNRSVESRENKRPVMSDLRESGAIEQDADVIMFIYRDEVYSKENCQEPGVAEVIISKQRNGPTGTAKVRFRGEVTKFCDLREEVGSFEMGDPVAEALPVAAVDFSELDGDPF